MPITTWSTNVQLAWDANPETNLQSYRLYRGTSSGNYDAATNVGLQTIAEVSGLVDGQTYYFAVSAINQSGLESGRSVEIAYQVPLNYPPVSNGENYTGTEDYPLTFVLNAADPEGKPLSVAVAVAPQHGLLSGTNLSWTFTPELNWFGNDSVTFSVSDGANTIPVTINLAVAPQNDDPVCVPPVGVSGDEDTSITAVLDAIDVDGDDLVFRIESQPANATVNLSGIVTAVITPKPNFNGSDAFSFSVFDGHVTRTASVPFTVRPVNDAPIANPNTLSVAEGQTIDLTLAGSDIDNDSLSFVVVANPSRGSLSGTPPNLVFSAPANFAGTVELQFTANDGKLTSAPATIAITIVAGNTEPIAAPQAIELAEDSSVEIHLNSSNVENASLAYAVSAWPAHGVLSGTPPNLTYTPSADFNGIDTFTFTVSKGALTSPPAAVSLTVTPVNDPPAAQNGSLTLDQNTSSSLVLVGTDVEGDSLAMTIVQSPTNGVLLGTAPSFTYQPNTNFFGSDTVLFTVTDGQATSTVAAVTITVNPIDLAPVALDSSVTLNEDIWTIVKLLGSSPQGLPLSYKITRFPPNGTISGTAPLLTLRPKLNFAGNDYLLYRVSDGVRTSAVARVDITVLPINDRPVATPITLALEKNTSIDITLLGTDVEGSPLTYTIPTPPTNGTLTGTPPDITYTPAPHFSGVDSFTYAVSDGGLESVPASVLLSVSFVNEPPTATSFAVSVAEDSSVALELDASDPDGDNVSFTVLQAPENGTLSGIAPNLSYHPNPNFFGSDSIIYGVSDGELDSIDATVTIMVTPVNDAPMAVTNSFTVYSGESVNIPLMALDIENDPLTFAVTTEPTLGTLSGTAPNLVYTADAGSTGIDFLRFVAMDASLASQPETIAITVIAKDTRPIAYPQSVVLAEDETLPINLVASDLEGSAMTYTVSAPLNGTLTGIAPNLLYRPKENYNGHDSFTFQVSDGSFTSDLATVSITVTAVNDAPVAVSSTITLNEDDTVPFLLLASDVEGSTLSYTITKMPTKGTLGGEAPNLTYTPNANYNGTDSIQFTANDGLTNTTNTAAVTFKIAPVNDGPKANPRSITLAEDSSLPFTLTGSDPEKDALYYQIRTQPLNGRVTGTPPNIRYTPNANFCGSDRFEFTVADRSLVSSPAVVSVSVTPVNDAPCAANASVSTTEATPVALPIVCTDVDGDPITMTVTKFPTGGTLAGTAPNLVYTPSSAFIGSDTVEYTVSDGKLTSPAGRISISVVQSTSAQSTDKVNGAFEGFSEDALVTYGGTTGLLISGAASVLANDVSADGTTLAATLGKAPANGTVTIQSDGTFTYTHLGGPALTDEFTYVATTSAGETSEVRVVIHVVRILDGVLTNAGTEIEISVAKGVVYQLDVQDLIPGSYRTWQNLVSFTGETDGIATLTDTTPVASTDRLYRLRCVGAFGEITTESWLRPAGRAAE
ncbi:MAG: tandem-95 repeat protein [Verrucomicrobiales bacterium]|nr:tandem-95 repeat protein [Verrucomicrobiales bacterium]